MLGFPCNQFGAPGAWDGGEIQRFCSETYDVTFPLFAKIDVNGPHAHPLYVWLKTQKRGVLGTDGDQVELHQVPRRPLRPRSSGATDHGPRRPASRPPFAGCFTTGCRGLSVFRLTPWACPSRGAGSTCSARSCRAASRWPAASPVSVELCNGPVRMVVVRPQSTGPVTAENRPDHAVETVELADAIGRREAQHAGPIGGPGAAERDAGHARDDEQPANGELQEADRGGQRERRHPETQHARERALRADAIDDAPQAKPPTTAQVIADRTSPELPPFALGCREPGRHRRR